MDAFASYLEDPRFYGAAFVGWVLLWVVWTVWRETHGGRGMHSRKR